MILQTGQPEETGIIIQTRNGSNIENDQATEISLLEENEFEELDNAYPNCTPRTGLIPIYNCHGLTFASRRTKIWDSTSIRTILNDDCYENISAANCLPGDIILYYSDDGDIEHSGIVVEAPRSDNFNSPKIVSKWGRGREFLHYAHMCPYTNTNLKFFRVME